VKRKGADLKKRKNWEKRRLEAEKKAEELRLAREKEEKERAEREAAENEINAEDIGPSDFVEVEKADDGDFLEKPIDVSEIDPEEFFGEDAKATSGDSKPINEDNSSQKETPSEFVVVDTPDEDVKYEETPSEFVASDDVDENNLEINLEEKQETAPSDVNVDSSVEEDLTVDDVETPIDDVVSEEAEVTAGEEVIEETPQNDAKTPIEEETSKYEPNDDKEVWEAEEEPISQNDDAEVWEDDEGISPEDNAEVWEDDKDYADDSESESKSFKEKFKSIFKHDDGDGDDNSSKTSFFESLKSVKDFNEDSDSNDEMEEEIIDNASVKSHFEDKVDLGSDDDYIYVDHSNDELHEEFEESTKPDIEDYAAKDDMDYSFDEEIIVDETPQNDDVKETTFKKPIFSNKINIKSDDSSKENEPVGEHDNIDEKMPENDNVDDEIVFEENHEPESDKVDLGSDDDYIYVDHSGDETVEEQNDDAHEDASFDETPQREVKVKSKSRRSNFVKSIISDVVGGESRLEPEEIETVRGEVIEEEEVPLHKPAPKDEFVVEAEIVNGANPSEDNLERPTPKDNYFEEDEELNIFTDELPDLSHDEYDEIHEEATRVIDKAMDEFMDDVFDKKPVNDSFEEKIRDKFVDEEIIDVGSENIVTDKTSDDIKVNHSQVEKDFAEPSNDIDIKDNEFGEDVAKSSSEFNDINAQDNEINDEILKDDASDIQDSQSISDAEPIEDDASTGEEVIYFKGANDVTNPLRKNNVYYKNEHKNKSIRDSIKGFKKDMQYINKSLNEIENPTQIDYVSVVDRTEEYDPNDYLSRPSDDDSDKIIQMEEELTFAEKEERRIERELDGERFENSIPAGDDVIVTVNNPQVREELKDQALENIIQTANEDYKEIEKERFKNENQLKAFDDKKLPGKRKLEDEIVDYVQASDIGLTPQNDLYAVPISKVAESVNAIVDIEGPIHIKEVTNRVKDSCNIKRAGSNLKKTVNLAIDEAENAGDIIKIGDFLYDASNNNVLVRKRNKPNVDLISDEEIAKSIELVLLYNDNVSTKQIAKEASRNFGFRSTSKKTASRINSVLDLMIANNRVKIVNDYVELN